MDVAREAPNIFEHELRGAEVEVWEGNRRVLKLERPVHYRRALRPWLR